MTWYCRKCGNTDIRHDAIAAWNPETSDYELVSVLDDTWCENCISKPPTYENEGSPVFGNLPTSSTQK